MVGYISVQLMLAGEAGKVDTTLKLRCWYYRKVASKVCAVSFLRLIALH